ncbi:hypothetical protein [Microseira sp. BLCC-F43]
MLNFVRSLKLGGNMLEKLTPKETTPEQPTPEQPEEIRRESKTTIFRNIR